MTATAEMPTTAAPERMEFKTELKQLLDLIIHSLYTKKEIFLRELVSNAADAIDKVRFEALTSPELGEGNTDWKIKLTADKAAGTLTVSDNGIGMSRATVVENLGTIAKSGTRAFMENLKASNAQDRPELIGQFGVGFYASFMAADKVTVLSRMAGPASEGVRWESDGQGDYTVEAADKPTRGTDVILHLREDAAEFLDGHRLKEVVRQYSNFIDHPVVIDVETETDGQKKVEEQTINARKAIWLRPKHEVKQEEYDEFYKQIARDWSPPLATMHVAAEGAMEFRALMFVPDHKPMDWMMGPAAKSGLDLYVKRVLIQHECEELLPAWLRFVKGVVDSSDLPLNVSRETLQHNAVLNRIKNNLVNRVLKTLDEMRTGEYEKYLKFYGEFSQVLKEGVGSEFGENRERLAGLLLVESTKTEPGRYTTLEQYLAGMTAGQDEVYYLIGESRRLLENSPYVESFKAKGQEVMLLTDPIDEFVVSNLPDYKGKKLKAADKGSAEANETDEQKAQAERFKPLLAALKSKLSDAKDVRLTHRLKESAACLVADEYGPSANLERLMKRMGQGGEAAAFKRTLELNPDHPAVQKLEAVYAADAADPKVEAYGRLLFDQAVIAEGSTIADPAAFAKRVNALITA